MAMSATFAGMDAIPLEPVGLHEGTPLPAGEAGASLARVHAVLQQHLPTGEVAIYEAGGGADSYLPAQLIRRGRVTVVDIDPVQLANNGYASTRVEGDIQVQRFAAGSFDLVTTYNVIEHLPDVAAALQRFAEALKPGGLLLVGAPNPRSLSGFVTRVSPHWFHVWYYRRIRGHARAGHPGEPPFPVHYHPLVLPRRLKAYLEPLGFETLYERVYESPRYAEMRQRLPLLASLMDAATDLMNLALLGKVNLRHGDYHLILRKRAPSADQGA